MSTGSARWPTGPRPRWDLPFAGDGVVEDLGSGRCSVEVGSWSWVSLAATLGRFDADIEVVCPPELTEAFAKLAARNAATAGV